MGEREGVSGIEHEHGPRVFARSKPALEPASNAKGLRLNRTDKQGGRSHLGHMQSVSLCEGSSRALECQNQAQRALVRTQRKYLHLH